MSVLSKPFLTQNVYTWKRLYHEVPLYGQDGVFTRFGFVCRERLIRLQHENKMLKLNQEGSDNEQIALLKSLLEDANVRKNELETENR